MKLTALVGFGTFSGNTKNCIDWRREDYYLLDCASGQIRTRNEIYPSLMGCGQLKAGNILCTEFNLNKNHIEISKDGTRNEITITQIKREEGKEYRLSICLNDVGDSIKLLRFEVSEESMFKDSERCAKLVNCSLCFDCLTQPLFFYSVTV